MFYTVIVVFPHTQITVLAMDNHTHSWTIALYIYTLHFI